MLELYGGEMGGQRRGVVDFVGRMLNSRVFRRRLVDASRHWRKGGEIGSSKEEEEDRKM